MNLLEILEYDRLRFGGGQILLSKKSNTPFFIILSNYTIFEKK